MLIIRHIHFFSSYKHKKYKQASFDVCDIYLAFYILQQPGIRNFHSRALSNSLCLSVVLTSFVFGLLIPEFNGL